MSQRSVPASEPHDAARDAPLDCLIVGGGPAGLTAALYLARFRRRALVVDAGEPRAAWIPKSHTLPMLEDGISGADLLARQERTASRYGARILRAEVAQLSREGKLFSAEMRTPAGANTRLQARHVLLATGARDVEPDLPGLPDAIRRGLVRYCPICDGYEASGRRIAVIGHGAHGLGEAVFLARSYSRNVTLLTLGRELVLDEREERRRAEHGIRIVPDPIAHLAIEDGRIAAFRTHGGEELTFDVLYSALGLARRSALAEALGAETDDAGAVVVDDHGQTSTHGLYAAGGVVKGLDQILVAMGQATIAATAIHNRCEIPTEEEGGA